MYRINLHRRESSRPIFFPPFFRHLFNKLVTERTSGPKAFLLQCHILFGLRVKGGILNQAIYKKPHVVFHLELEQNIHYSYAF